jgi:hypothetical protein
LAAQGVNYAVAERRLAAFQLAWCHVESLRVGPRNVSGEVLGMGGIVPRRPNPRQCDAGHVVNAAD